MKFRMNNLEWEIKKVSADEVKSHFKDCNEESYYFGCTTFSKQEVLINGEATLDKQRETLYHELMHCYIYCYICDGLSFDEEGICNISAKSHDMIHKIVEEYFKEVEIEDVESKYSCKSNTEILKMIQEQQKFGKDEGWKEMKL